MRTGRYLIMLCLLTIFSCQGLDITGKVVIDYDDSWTGVIILDNSETAVSGTGRQEYVYKNPDKLEADITKQDSSLNKITLYIYEDERIVASDSTRDPGGIVSAAYEYPY
jgi:hypothetical protein